MKILLIHQHFRNPREGGALRSYFLAKALVDAGLQVVVITADNGSACRQEDVDGIVVHYLPVPYDNRFGFGRRILAFYQFMRKASAFAGRHRDAQLCYAISTPLTVGLAARRIKNRLGIPYFFEVGDLWPEAPIEMGFISWPPLQRYLYRIQARIYRDAEAVVALSVPIKEAVRRTEPDTPVHLIPNMADTAFYRREEKVPALEAKYGVEGRFVVSYIGAVGVANGLHHFLECAAASERAGLPIHFLLCGDGAMLATLKREAMELGLHRLTFVPFQSRAGVAEVMNVTDANFVSYQPFRILETGSPNKYFDGLAASKLTVVNFGGWIRQEVERERCGVYVDPRNGEHLVQAIRPFVEDVELLRKYQQAGRALAEREYSREALAAKFAAIIRGAISDSGQAPRGA